MESSIKENPEQKRENDNFSFRFLVSTVLARAKLSDTEKNKFKKALEKKSDKEIFECLIDAPKELHYFFAKLEKLSLEKTNKEYLDIFFQCGFIGNLIKQPYYLSSVVRLLKKTYQLSNSQEAYQSILDHLEEREINDEISYAFHPSFRENVNKVSNGGTATYIDRLLRHFSFFAAQKFVNYLIYDIAALNNILNFYKDKDKTIRTQIFINLLSRPKLVKTWLCPPEEFELLVACFGEVSRRELKESRSPADTRQIIEERIFSSYYNERRLKPSVRRKLLENNREFDVFLDIFDEETQKNIVSDLFCIHGEEGWKKEQQYPYKWIISSFCNFRSFLRCFDNPIYKSYAFECLLDKEAFGEIASERKYYTLRRLLCEPDTVEFAALPPKNQERILKKTIRNKDFCFKFLLDVCVISRVLENFPREKTNFFILTVSNQAFIESLLEENSNPGQAVFQIEGFLKTFPSESQKKTILRHLKRFICAKKSTCSLFDEFNQLLLLTTKFYPKQSLLLRSVLKTVLDNNPLFYKTMLLERTSENKLITEIALQHPKNKNIICKTIDDCYALLMENSKLRSLFKNWWIKRRRKNKSIRYRIDHSYISDTKTPHRSAIQYIMDLVELFPGKRKEIVNKIFADKVLCFLVSTNFHEVLFVATKFPEIADVMYNNLLKNSLFYTHVLNKADLILLAADNLPKFKTLIFERTVKSPRFVENLLGKCHDREDRTICMHDLLCAFAFSFLDPDQKNKEGNERETLMRNLFASKKSYLRPLTSSVPKERNKQEILMRYIFASNKSRVKSLASSVPRKSIRLAELSPNRLSSLANKR